MTEMTLTEAAKWAGVSRPTIHKALTGKLKGRPLSGRLDENREWRIDQAALARVFKPAAARDLKANGAATAAAIAAKDQEIGLLREMVATLKEDKADLRAERDRLLGIVSRQAAAPGPPQADKAGATALRDTIARKTTGRGAAISTHGT